jgi:hypothetical protein
MQMMVRENEESERAQVKLLNSELEMQHRKYDELKKDVINMDQQCEKLVVCDINIYRIINNFIPILRSDQSSYNKCRIKRYQEWKQSAQKGDRRIEETIHRQIQSSKRIRGIERQEQTVGGKNYLLGGLIFIPAVQEYIFLFCRMN